MSISEIWGFQSLRFVVLFCMCYKSRKRYVNEVYITRLHIIFTQLLALNAETKHINDDWQYSGDVLNFVSNVTTSVCST